MNVRNKTQRLTVLTMLLAMAIVVNMIEPIIPIGLPGVKLGLANVLGLLAFYFFGAKEMFVVNLLRVVTASLLRATFLGTGFWLAFVGALFSSLMIIVFDALTPMSEVGISCVSATFHNIGQILVIILITSQVVMITYLPIMLLLGIPTGIVTGYLVKSVNHRIKIH